MKETNRFWAKNDEFKISDVKESCPSPDPFKTTYTKKESKD